MRGVLLLTPLVGCSFSATTPPPAVDDPVRDASLIDVPTVMIDACVTFSSQLDTCTIPEGGNQPLALTGSNTYDTESHVLRRGQTVIPVAHATVMTTTGVIDVIYVSDFSLADGASLRPFGPLPFAIAASGTVQIDGEIDLVGPAAGSRTDAVCGASTGTRGDESNQGGGGSGGGAFQGDGGDGSDGNSDGQQQDGGPGGTKIALPTGLLGGCDGGDGSRTMGFGAQAGDGGGAILITAGGSITIGTSGVINAGGGRGRRGAANGRGGSGGGSGGMIFLESAQVTVLGVLAANGGGGGEGQTFGRDGEDGQPSDQPASGGANGDSNGGNGADGSAGTNLDGDDSNDVRPGGGGGGGGGAGYITIRCPAPMTADGTISPPVTPWPN